MGATGRFLARGGRFRVLRATAPRDFQTNPPLGVEMGQQGSKQRALQPFRLPSRRASLGPFPLGSSYPEHARNVWRCGCPAAGVDTSAAEVEVPPLSGPGEGAGPDQAKAAEGGNTSPSNPYFAWVESIREIRQGPHCDLGIWLAGSSIPTVPP